MFNLEYFTCPADSGGLSNAFWFSHSVDNQIGNFPPIFRMGSLGKPEKNMAIDLPASARAKEVYKVRHDQASGVCPHQSRQTS
jgi:hypothetical protein